jgi:hypothetical protein
MLRPLSLQYLSGMKEELSLYGNELVTATSIWTVGYVVGQVSGTCRLALCNRADSPCRSRPTFFLHVSLLDGSSLV